MSIGNVGAPLIFVKGQDWVDNLNTVANTNISAIIANYAISHDREMSVSMEKLATGSRTTSAKDDAASLAMSSRMASQIGGLEMGLRNVNDAISLLKTADAATKEITNMLGRMRELAVQASSDTYTTTDRAALDQEYESLLREIDRIAATTEWNGQEVLAGADMTVTSNLSAAKSIDIQSGGNASETTNIVLKSWRPTGAVDAAMEVDGSTWTGVDSQTPNSTVVTCSDVSVDADTNGSYYLAGMNVGIYNVGASAQTLSAADHAAIYAEETTELAHSQITMQACIAMLAQANQSKQSVLTLLR